MFGKITALHREVQTSQDDVFFRVDVFFGKKGGIHSCVYRVSPFEYAADPLTTVAIFADRDELKSMGIEGFKNLVGNIAASACTEYGSSKSHRVENARKEARFRLIRMQAN